MLTLSLLSLAHATTWTVDPASGGDATTIADGVALLSDGDTLSIAAGTYDNYESGPIYVEASNVVLQGAGWDSTIFDGAMGAGGGDPGELIVSGDNVVVTGISFRNYVLLPHPDPL